MSERALLHTGLAVNALTVESGQVWRLITAQIFHVKPLHMLFNVLMCWCLGYWLERRFGHWPFAAIYWVGGIIGILAALWWLPGSIGTGASQALMALCGAAIAYRLKPAVWLALAVTAIQLALDFYVDRHPKPGHVAGFLAGALGAGLGAWLKMFNVKRIQNDRAGFFQ